MKVKLQFPFSAENPVGAFESHYGVSFTVVESDSTGALLVADLPEEEAQAMIEAGRVTEYVADLPDEEAGKKGKK